MITLQYLVCTARFLQMKTAYSRVSHQHIGNHICTANASSQLICCINVNTTLFYSAMAISKNSPVAILYTILTLTVTLTRGLMLDNNVTQRMTGASAAWINTYSPQWNAQATARLVQCALCWQYVVNSTKKLMLKYLLVILHLLYLFVLCVGNDEISPLFAHHRSVDYYGFRLKIIIRDIFHFL